MSYKPPREHRIGSWNKGCRCDSCRAANRKQGRYYRSRKYQNREPHPNGRMCIGCGLMFAPRGHAQHEKFCVLALRR